MRAIQVTAPRKIEMVDLPRPAMAPGKVLMRTAMVSICGSDWPQVLGNHPEEEYPKDAGWPGHEISGIVEESDSPEFKPGDRVLDVGYEGGFREFKVREPSQLVKLPSDRPIQEFLMSQPLGVVLHGAQRIPNPLGKRIVVIGQGAIGLFFTAVLHMQGAHEIITMDLEETRLGVGAKMGATHPVNTAKMDPVEAVMELTGGEGADIVVEAVGQEFTFNLPGALVKNQGFILFFGLPKKNPMLFDFRSFLWPKEPTITNSSRGYTPDFTLARDLIASRQIDVRPLMTHKLPITEVQKAFELAESRAEGAVKIAMEW